MPETAQDEVEIAGGAKVRVGDTVWWTPSEMDVEWGIPELVQAKLTSLAGKMGFAEILVGGIFRCRRLHRLHPTRAAAIDYLIGIQRTAKAQADAEIARLEALKAERSEARTG